MHAPPLSWVVKVQEQEAEGGAHHEPHVEEPERPSALHRLLQVLPPSHHLFVGRHGGVENVLHPLLLLHNFAGEEAHETRDLQRSRPAPGGRRRRERVQYFPAGSILRGCICGEGVIRDRRKLLGVLCDICSKAWSGLFSRREEDESKMGLV